MDMLKEVFVIVVFILGYYFGNHNATNINAVHELFRKREDHARRNALKTFNEGRYAGISHGQSALNGYQAGQSSVLDGGGGMDEDYDGSAPLPDDDPPTKH
jgi:hypothetical protein